MPDLCAAPKGRKCSESRYRRVFWALILILAVLFFLSLSVGRYYVPLGETVKIMFSLILPIQQTWTDMMENVIYNIRLPRLAAAILVGAGLAASGAAYQGIFRNPLVSPDLLGVSAGACVGAACAIFLRLNNFGIQLAALGLGLVTVLLTVSIPRIFRNDSTLMLVLSGVIVGGFMSSILGLLKYVADPEEELASIVYWTLGSFSAVRRDTILLVAPAMLAACLVLLLLRWRINLLSLGDNEAKALGMNLKQIRGICIVCATLLTACAVCISGTIGWVGLIIPHLGRLLTGQDHRYLLPVSVVLGACFMIAVDIVARNLTGSEIPLSILTGLTGAPLFVWLVVKQKGRIR